jgi:hypothetical protein
VLLLGQPKRDVLNGQLVSPHSAGQRMEEIGSLNNRWSNQSAGLE